MLYFKVVKPDKFTHITDQELLDRFYSDGDNQWLGLLLQRYTLLLLGTCMKYLKNEDGAKDSVQQIFLKAITELQKYKVQYFKSWLYMVARNHCLMQLRNKNMFLTIDDTTNIQSEENDISEIKDKDTTLNLLEESMGELNEDQKTCVTLFYLKKKSYREIADTTGYSLMQVKSHIQNGKRNLKTLVEKKLKKNNGRPG